MGTVASAVSPWATSGQITAPEARYAMAAGFAKSPSSTIQAEGGVIEGANPGASISGANCVVTAHQAVVESANGTFVGTAPASLSVPLQTPNPSAGQSRYDIVYGEITGAADTAAVYSLTSVTGTASGSPSIPSAPANTTPLFRVQVTNAGPQTPVPIYGYTRAPGGIRLVAAGDVRAGSFTGDLRKFSNGQIDVWNGSAWVTITAPAAWSQFTPVLTSAAGGVVNLGAGGSAVGRYIVVGKLCHLRYIFDAAGAGRAGGKGQVTCQLPPGVTAAPSGETQILAKLNAKRFSNEALWSIMLGVCFINAGTTTMQPYFPRITNDVGLGPYQIADSGAGAAGTGIPVLPGEFVMPGPLVIQGTIEIS